MAVSSHRTLASRTGQSRRTPQVHARPTCIQQGDNEHQRLAHDEQFNDEDRSPGERRRRVQRQPA
jgi:hypothetical protein